MKQIHVAVGVILRGKDTFITRRLAHQHQGGKWEFPGGKIEPGESVTQALSRELQEEVGICIDASEPLMVIEHNYPDKSVKLDIHRVFSFSGEPAGAEGQESMWVSIHELPSLDFPDANGPIIEKLIEVA
ncbi:8-oxo-dGTP diphosphatase MutT [Alteromonas sp. a30]|uniref:8-oxo-dGTP diphosphatase MutT n=1 Tax=Alteromonas sp. a30 TaxID=2730917 RepID=UPI0022810CF0|nr:8-oxo-dGTP diphosphatase MutT [Alteromonas sp. a30]MCY7294240.1 8-oxo-dGTP diphosphatase MutT [Alteromonas sp. a30]